MKRTFNSIDYFFPVIGGKCKNEDIIINQIYGTASYIQNNIFITAGHSIENAKTNNSFGIGYITEPLSKWQFIKAIDFEIFKDIDIGIFKCEKSCLNFASFCTKNRFEPFLLMDVFTCGFPHAFDIKEKQIKRRALKGYIVNSGNFYEFKKPIVILELSFHCPVGISGAPILMWHQDEMPTVCGYIIGNTTTEIPIVIEKEISNEGKKEIIYEKTESTKYGIGINIEELLLKESRILGNMTFKQYFKNNNM